MGGRTETIPQLYNLRMKRFFAYITKISNFRHKTKKKRYLTSELQPLPILYINNIIRALSVNIKTASQ